MISAVQCELKYKDGTLALKPFDLEIGAGEIVVILGPSGSGKTSLLKLLMGIEVPTNGTISVLNQVIKSGQERQIRMLRTKLGPVFQEFRLVEGHSVLDNVMLGLRFLDFTHDQMKEIATEYIKRVGLSHKIDHTVEQLSWGECQRVAIARAVARKPRIIIADEPTGNLDQENAINVLNLLASFADEQTSVIITTHAAHLVNTFKSTMKLTMSDGCFQVERGRR
ncbi:cell division ATP-binding protein FtsE [Fusibacter bizertensis]